ncbi:MAG: hypothetical protein BWY79_01746 [Actinobacteria bacterium ADurb.Bin444]|nr:MAG: hypothetical protein BWY79_01746 [Actinobacteria bacterium ADurb.Bin444]
MLAGAGRKVRRLDLPSGLLLQSPQHLGEGEARLPSGREAPEVADGLDVYTPHHRHHIGRIAHDGPQLPIVDACHHGGHQHHCQSGLSAMLHGPQLLLQRHPTADGLCRGRAEAVELQKDGGGPSLP